MSYPPNYSDHRVFYDHGDTTVDANVAVPKGFFGDAVSNLNRLADVDIIVVGPDNRVRLLIEIEERDASPKKFLGDVLAVLLCNQFAVKQKHNQINFGLTPKTELIVAGVVPTRGHRLKKIEETILPRLRQMRGMSDGISPSNVTLLFSANVLATISQLAALIESRFPGSAFPG